MHPRRGKKKRKKTKPRSSSFPRFYFQPPDRDPRTDSFLLLYVCVKMPHAHRPRDFSPPLLSPHFDEKEEKTKSVFFSLIITSSSSVLLLV